MSFLDAIFKPLERQRARLRELGEQERTLLRERDAILAAPAARSDVKAAAARLVQSAGTSHRATLENALRALARAPASLGPDVVPSRSLPFSVVGDGSSAAGIEQALCALLQTQLVVLLHDVVDKMEWPAGAAPGLPWDERPAAMAAIDARIGTIQQELREITSQLEGAGISPVEPERI